MLNLFLKEKWVLRVKHVLTRFCSSEALNLSPVLFPLQSLQTLRIKRVFTSSSDGLTHANLQGWSFMMTWDSLETLECLHCTKTGMTILFLSSSFNLLRWSPASFPHLFPTMRILLRKPFKRGAVNYQWSVTSCWVLSLAFVSVCCL